MRLKNRLFISHILISVTPIIILVVLVYFLFMSTLKNNASQYLEQSIDQVASNLDNVIVQTERTANIIINEPEIQLALREPIKGTKSEEYAYAFYINGILNNLHYSSNPDTFFGFYVLNKFDRKYKSNNLSYNEIDFQKQPWFIDLIAQKQLIWYPSHKDSFVVETAGNNFITLGVPVTDKSTGGISGLVLIDISTDTIKNIVANANIGENSLIQVLDDQALICSLSQPSNIDVKNSNPANLYDLNYSRKLANNWNIVGMASSYDIMKNSLISFSIIVLITLILVLTSAILIANRVSSTISKPIRNMMNLMHQVEQGDLSVMMKENANNYEVRKLSKSFNVMVKKISDLLENIKNEQADLRKAQFAALQAQINPHFLYNTLDTISWSIRLKHDQDALMAITALSKLFRISLSRGKEIIQLKDEIEHVRMYLSLLQLRYSEEMEFQIEISDSLFNYITPKLILQPLVENAVYHGIKNRDSKGKVTIFAKEFAEEIQITVEDNGVGISKDNLDKINKMMNQVDTEQVSSFGIVNVNSRIKIYFGDQYGLQFFSEENQFTRVLIRLPKLLEINPHKTFLKEDHS